MKNKKTRLNTIAQLLSENVIGSQDELLKLLAIRGLNVTQATLSRDLKKLKTTKVATDTGGYRYILNGNDNPAGEPFAKVRSTSQQPTHPAALSLDISGNILVIKTMIGYASGLAYDLDMLKSEYILGTIPGSDTVFAVINDRVNLAEIFKMLQGFLPDEILQAAAHKFIDK